MEDNLTGHRVNDPGIRQLFTQTGKSNSFSIELFTSHGGVYAAFG